jgi:hypothetical protein
MTMASYNRSLELARRPPGPAGMAQIHVTALAHSATAIEELDIGGAYASTETHR